ncbi:MAG: thioredoxin TrxA [Burkholderiales bacterium]
MTHESIQPVTDASFDSDVLQHHQPVLVDYWATWCGPCKSIAPLLDAAAVDYAGRLRIAKMNIEESPRTPPKYGVRGVPTLMLFKGGKLAATKVGAVTKVQLDAFIEAHL